MCETHPTTDQSRPPPAVPKDGAARQSWENEGGATRDGPSTQGPVVVEHPAPAVDPSPRETAAVDAAQDKLMSITSSDGGPPPRGWQLTGWHWLAVVVPLLLVIGGAVWVAWAMGVGVALVGLVLLAAMAGAAAPVWGAGLLRGGEERAARIEAEAEVRAERGPERGRQAGPGRFIPTHRGTAVSRGGGL